MKKDYLLKKISDIAESAKELNISFKSVGYTELYPIEENVHFESSANESVSTDAQLNYQMSTLSILAPITGCYRSHETKNPFLRLFFPKLRRYLFREVDFRYGFILQSQQDFNLHAIETLKVLKASIDSLQTQSAEKEKILQASIDGLQTQLIEKEGQINSLKKLLNTELQEIQYPSLDIDYFKFENQFRGAEQEICWRLEKYLKYFEGCKNVIDVGCGRGEFLDICRNKGIKASGLDLSEQFCEYVANKGHSVIRDDVIHFLGEKEDEHFDGIFAAHILEHLTEKDLLKVIKLFYAKLKKGTYCTIETPNAESIYGLTQWFYTDLTHRKPLHPQTLEFIFKEAGFSEVTVQRIDYVDVSAMSEVEKMIMRPFDFAIIARK